MRSLRLLVEVGAITFEFGSPDASFAKLRRVWASDPRFAEMVEAHRAGDTDRAAACALEVNQEEVEALLCSLFVEGVRGWSGFTLDGVDVPFSPENARDVPTELKLFAANGYLAKRNELLGKALRLGGPAIARTPVNGDAPGAGTSSHTQRPRSGRKKQPGGRGRSRR